MMRVFGIVLPALVLAAACGSDPPPPVRVPTAETVRALYGLVPNSCYLYRQLGQQNLTARFDISGPNDIAVAGKTVYVRRYSRVEGGGRPVEEYLETNDEAEIRLLRHVDASAVARRYEDSTAPLFARFAYDSKGEVALKVGERFETLATPQGMPEERHEWTVNSDSANAVTPDGPKAAYDLQYRINGGPIAQYLVVPDFGVAVFVDFDQVTHQVCAARVCDASGACTGAPSCDDLLCP